jgi:hypothetical protein
MTGNLFCVGNKPYCVWEANDSNKDAIRGIDPSYFSYLAATHTANLQGEHRSKAVAALSTSYYHGLETLFMLIFAALQAPRCVSGWLLKCWPQQLRELVADMSVGKFPRAVRWKLQAGSWESVSKLMNGKLFAGLPEANEMVESFGVLWTRFARDYTEEYRIDEYNSFKHGFRIQVGVGPTVTIRQKADGSIPPPDQAKLPILQSDFGSSFCVEHELVDAHDPNLKHHFTIKYCHVNLQAEDLAKDLELLRISIHNVVAFLKMANGFPNGEISVASPDEKEVFKQSDAKSGNLARITFSPKISENDIEKLTKEEILRRL